MKNDHLGQSKFEFYDIYHNVTHVLSKFQDTKNWQCYHGAIFNPKSSQKVPRIAIFTYKMNEAFLDLILIQSLCQIDFLDVYSVIYEYFLVMYPKSMQNTSKNARNEQ